MLAYYRNGSGPCTAHKYTIHRYTVHKYTIHRHTVTHIHSGSHTVTQGHRPKMQLRPNLNLVAGRQPLWEAKV